MTEATVSVPEPPQLRVSGSAALGPDRHREGAAGERRARGSFRSSDIQRKFLATVPENSSSQPNDVMTAASGVERLPTRRILQDPGEGLEISEIMVSTIRMRRLRD